MEHGRGALLLKDYAVWLIALAFFLIGLLRLGIPEHRYFDEVHYVMAAARLLQGLDVANREHPMLGKELIALSMALFGVSPAGWRLGSLIAGTLGLLAGSKALGAYSGSRSAEVIFAALLASNFQLFALSRIALLDIYMFAFTAGGLLFLARGKRWASGLLFGLAIACKWSAVPVLAGVLAIGVWQSRSSPGATGARLVQFGVVPAGVYFLTYVPGLAIANGLALGELIPLQFAMLAWLGGDFGGHAYASSWWQWVLNVAPVWMGGEAKVLLAGNPVTMLAVIPAAAWGLRHQRALALSFLGLLAFWAAMWKPTQLYHHYLLPGSFGLAVLAAYLSRGWDRARRWPAVVAVGLAIAMFAAFYPALTGTQDPSRFAFLPGWSEKSASPPPKRAIRERQCLREPRSCYTIGGVGV